MSEATLLQSSAVSGHVAAPLGCGLRAPVKAGAALMFVRPARHVSQYPKRHGISVPFAVI